MFARWFFVKLRAAEKALEQGRLDDAYAAAVNHGFRADSRGQKLLDALVKPLIARARLHRQAGRYSDALADLDKLEAIDRAGPDVQTLRQQVLEEMRRGAADAAEQHEAAVRAADRLRAGRLETGRIDIERVEDSRRRADLAEELQRRVQRGSELLRQAREALDRDDLLVAVRFWQEACNRFGRTAESNETAARLAAACRRALDRWHQEGRLERLLVAGPGIGALVAHDPTLAEHERLLELCARAAGQLAARDYDGLRRTLLRIKAAGGEAAWVTAALAALAQIGEGQELLLASPLGLFMSVPGGPVEETRMTRPAQAGTADAGHEDQPCERNAARLDEALLLLVDGGGSSLLLRSDLIRLGRAGSSAGIDVPIPADVQSHHADLVRRGDDCFLTAYGPVEVNQSRIEHVLLRDGDRIVLGGKAKITFVKPSSVSASAVLRMSHRCRLPQDVSEVILFRDTCLIGPDVACHVRTNADHGRVVLFERAGCLRARQTAGRHYLSNDVRSVAVGDTVELGDLRFTIKRYEHCPGATT